MSTELAAQYELVATDLSDDQIDKLGAFAVQAERLAREMPTGFADLLLQLSRIIAHQLVCVDIEHQWQEENGGCDSGHLTADIDGEVAPLATR